MFIAHFVCVLSTHFFFFSSLHWICYNTASALCFVFFGPGAYGILVPQTGIELTHPVSEGKVLNTDCQGSPLIPHT